ncbi:MAG: hypothetical protein GVX90_04685 [Alphaproteobacteria bacterium]|nr:hypothetical protein [Alphaproteobacteria bacterium]
MKLVRIAAGLLPLAGLAGLWAMGESVSREGTDWEVPIAGYDPRDLLRGHYVEFTYDWPIPQVDRDAGTEQAMRPAAPPPQGLCLRGDPPQLREAIPFDPYDYGARERCAHPIVADPGSVYGPAMLERGRLYVGQDRAREIEDMLRERDLRGIVTLRQRPDGSFTPLDIRFRALTRSERAERERGSIRPTAPPIMEERVENE